ncbi:uncharacterized protein AB9X84_011730 isoform 1-T3 [Acanthopagrus schlegelii]
MKVHLMLICFIFSLSLQDEITGFISVEIPNLTGKEGGTITYECTVFVSGSRKTFSPLMLKPTRTLPPPLTSASTSTPSTFTLTPTPATSAAATGVQLCVRLTLVVIFIVSSAAVLIFCRRRASKAEDPPVEAEYLNVTEANPVYEELGEDRWSRSPPEEISAGHNLPSSQFAEDSV